MPMDAAGTEEIAPRFPLYLGKPQTVSHSAHRLDDDEESYKISKPTKALSSTTPLEDPRRPYVDKDLLDSRS
jgi:hypothetical protein